jgi:hypothetical protein
MLRIILLTLSLIAGVSGVVLYAVSIVRGTTRPHKMTRFIIFFILTLNFASISAADSNLGAVLYAGLSFTHGTVLFGMSLWRGMGGRSKLDFFCLAIAGVGIAGWQITGNPLVGVWFAILADFAAYVPAFVKTWHFPESESHWLYTLSIFAAGLSMAAYPVGVDSIFQIYIVAASAIMVAIIFKEKLGKSPNPKPQIST